MRRINRIQKPHDVTQIKKTHNQLKSKKQHKIKISIYIYTSSTLVFLQHRNRLVNKKIN
ncbi:hypothetical protein D3C79_135840 [compost metagenome]